MIKRLRPKYSDMELKEIYVTPHNHTHWEDHVYRVHETIKLANQLLADTDVSGADLSCGDGAIINSLPLKQRILGDYAPGYEFTGPIEQCIDDIPFVNVFVLCETLEHLDDPILVLRKIRRKAGKLVLSTPLNEQNNENVEHYWGWDRQGIYELLERTLWTPVLYRETPLKSGWYQFQIWGCE